MDKAYTVSEYHQLVRKLGIDDNERRLWVLNNEELYRWYRSEKVSMSKFIRENREDITLTILAILE